MHNRFESTKSHEIRVLREIQQCINTKNLCNIRLVDVKNFLIRFRAELFVIFCNQKTSL